MRKTSKLPGAPAPRIVFESSELHRFAPSDLKYASLAEINNDQFNPIQLYAMTKAAMICGMRGIYEKVIKPNSDNVFVLAVHPGVYLRCPSRPMVPANAVSFVGTVNSSSEDPSAYGPQLSLGAARSDRFTLQLFISTAPLQDEWQEAYGSVAGKIIEGVTLALSRNAEQGSYSGMCVVLLPFYYLSYTDCPLSSSKPFPPSLANPSAPSPQLRRLRP